MGVNDRIRWEGQRATASMPEVRRLELRRSGARHVLLALGIASLVVVAGWSLAGLDGLVTRFPVDASRHQNRVLRAQQESLRENAFELAGRLAETVERGRRIARLTGAPARTWQGQYPRPPAREAGDEAMAAWLSEEGSRLESIGDELTAGRMDPTLTLVKQASTPAPLIVGWVSISGEPARVVADIGGSARQPEAASAQR